MGAELAGRSFIDSERRFVVEIVFILYDPLVASMNVPIGLVPIKSIECYENRRAQKLLIKKLIQNPDQMYMCELFATTSVIRSVTTLDLNENKRKTTAREN